MRWNLLNGDCAWTEWRKTPLPGAVLVWRENYLQGQIPITRNRTEFNRIRAAELHKSATERPVESIFSELEQMHRTLLSLTPEDTLLLWFDQCPFDRIMQTRILMLLNSIPTPPGILLISKDVVWTCEAFLRFSSDAVPVDREELAAAENAWAHFAEQRNRSRSGSDADHPDKRFF